MTSVRYIDMVDQQRVLDEFVELVKIDSGCLEERLLTDAIRPRLEALGARVKEDDAGKDLGGNSGNLLAWISGSAPGPTVLLSAHMDRVPPGHGICPVVEAGVDGTFRSGHIRSDGRTILAADDVGGIVAILEGLRILKENALPHPPVVVTFTVAEEIGLWGAKALDASELGADIGFVFDAGGPIGNIVLAAPFQVKIRVTVHGALAHAGIEPERGINAILVAAEAMAAMKIGRIDEVTTSNIGVFTAGGGTNIVPDRAEIQGEVRSHVRSRLDEQVEMMRSRFEQAAQAHGASVDFVVEEVYPGFILAEDAPVVALACTAALALGQEDIKPTFTKTGGGSDANILNSMGVPTVPLGMGFEKAHSTHEVVPFQQLVRGCALAAALAHIAAE